MKTDRLLAETIYLLQRGRVTSRQMAERFEVSRRTILRDMDALSLAGIPVTSLDGAGGGYQLEESYRLDHRAADRQDVELILVALRALSTAMDDSHLQSAIEKFQPLEKESGAEPLSVDLSVLNESARVQRNLRALRRAIREKSVVRITYVSAAGREAIHEVEPLRLDYRWYAWYLTAWSRRHDKPVTFKLIRMDGVEPTGERCPERPPVELPEDSRSEVEVTFRCKPAARVPAIEYLHAEPAGTLENGDLLFRASLPQEEFFWRGALLALGTQIEVISPPEVVEEMRRRSRELNEMYREKER